MEMKELQRPEDGVPPAIPHPMVPESTQGKKDQPGDDQAENDLAGKAAVGGSHKSVEIAQQAGGLPAILILAPRGSRVRAHGLS
jgi:hypothetical protein